MTESPYLFRAADHPLAQANERLKVREAHSGFGIALRYQERAPDPNAPEADGEEETDTVDASEPTTGPDDAEETA